MVSSPSDLQGGKSHKAIIYTKIRTALEGKAPRIHNFCNRNVAILGHCNDFLGSLGLARESLVAMENGGKIIFSANPICFVQTVATLFAD
jgi:hypothetical protein